MLIAVFTAGCARATATAPTLDELGDIAYRGIYRQPLTLTNGVYEGAPFVPGGASHPRVQLIRALHAVGDLDGDAIAETAVLLAESSGGSGARTYVAVVARRDGQATNVATRLIGDRVQIRRLAIDVGAVVLEIVAAGPNDATCCPTAKRRLVLQLVDQELVQAQSEELGPLTVADLEGVIWRAVQLGRDAPVPEAVSVTAVFEAGRISGSAGCNGYFGSVSGGPNDLKLGPIAATRRACEPPIMAVEDRYLSALQRATMFGFHLGRLALTYRAKDAVDMLLFEAAP